MRFTERFQRGRYVGSVNHREEDGMKKAIGLTLGLALMTSLALVVPAGVALAGNNDVIEEGSCGGSSDWKLKISPEDGGLEVEFEVDQNVSGDRWRVKIRHDGDLAFTGTRRTHGASGSFEVRIVEDDRAGTDRFRAKARNLSTDEVCLGIASF
jgi:hypothetical protein